MQTIKMRTAKWDDLLCLAETQVQDAAISVMKEQLEKDKRALENGGEVSLLGKWLPSINTSSKEKVRLAKIVMPALGMKACEYRKLCTALRAEIKILENNLRLKDYTFDYSKQPCQAMLCYKKAFIRNDGERYGAYLKQVMEQAKKIARGDFAGNTIVVRDGSGSMYHGTGSRYQKTGSGDRRLGSTP